MLTIFIDTMDLEENMYALASAAHEQSQISHACRSQMELPLRIEDFAFVDLTGDGDMDHGVFSASECQELIHVPLAACCG
jgi:hypothetical protein